MKKIRVADLQDQTNKPYPWPILYCSMCGEEYSAHKGDYWNSSPNHVFQHCHRNMRLVVKKIVFQEVENCSE